MPVSFSGIAASIIAVVSFTVSAAPADAAALVDDPILRIETGMHTGSIRGTAGDRGCRLLVTGGYDKTIRVWGLKPGYRARLIRVIRPPIGRGIDGWIYSVALSPDNSLIAAASFTQEHNHWIQIFETQSGRLIHRLGRFQEPIYRVAFSPDGRRLAALGRKEGLRVWEAPQWRLLIADRDYGEEQAFGIAFDVNGRLFTTSMEGLLRLYGPDLRLIQKIRTRGGREPFRVAAHPDGSVVAVGYTDSPSIDIYRAGDLQFLFAADTRDVNLPGLAQVAWSPDGRRLFAGGTFQINKQTVLRFWDHAGRGPGQNRIASENTITDIVPCDYGVSVGASDPAIVQLTRDVVRYSYEGSVASDMGGKLFSAFTMSTDARQVRFGLGKGNTDPWLFDVGKLQFIASPHPPKDLYRALVEDSETNINGLLSLIGPQSASAPNRIAPKGLRIEGWNGNKTPTLNGRPLKIPDGSTSQALAIKPDRSGFLLASSRHLHHFDAAGRQIWIRPSADFLRGVLVSSDNRIVVTANADGTIRWHRMSDGREMLTLFVHAQDKRWVIWTPKGYYASSPGGDDLIGWHVNRDWNTVADFFPASQFRQIFYRPDIVQRMLIDLDEDKAIAEANRLSGRRPGAVEVRNALPPVIEILTPAGGTSFTGNTINISYRLRTPSKMDVNRVEVLIDGRPLATRGLGQVKTSLGDSHNISVPVPARNVEISLIAHTAKSASVPARVTLRWAGGALSGEPAEGITKPKLYALLIGVSQYDLPHLRLGYAAKDAADLAAALKSQVGGVYREVELKVLTDKQATGKNILEALDWLEGEVTSRDVGLLFMAGHGITDPKQRFYYLPVDGDPKNLRSTAIAKSDIRDIVGSLAGKSLMFLDACHSGRGIDTRRTRGAADITAIVNDLASAENGVVMFASSTGRELSEEDDAWQNGAFTEALLEGLKGKADYSKDGVISISELDLWLSERVKALTKKRQHPVMQRPTTIPDFPIAIAR